MKMWLKVMLLSMVSTCALAQENYKVVLMNGSSVNYSLGENSKLYLSNKNDRSLPKNQPVIEVDIKKDLAQVSVSGTAVKQFETENLETESDKEIAQEPNSVRQYNTEQYGLIMPKKKLSDSDKNPPKTAQKFIVEQEFKLPREVGESVVVNFNDPHDNKTPENFKNRDLVKITRVN